VAFSFIFRNDNWKNCSVLLYTTTLFLVPFVFSIVFLFQNCWIQNLRIKASYHYLVEWVCGGVLSIIICRNISAFRSSLTERESPALTVFYCPSIKFDFLSTHSFFWTSKLESEYNLCAVAIVWLLHIHKVLSSLSGWDSAGEESCGLERRGGSHLNGRSFIYGIHIMI
jgi:hypothetical protein